MSFKSLPFVVPAFAIAVLALVVASGCSEPDHDHGDHKGGAAAHDDDHPAHGPNHGHIFKSDSTDYQFEWKKYPDSNVIKMFVLDAEGKKNTKVAATSFFVKPQVGEGDEKFELKPEEADENGLSDLYMLDDADLAIAIPLGVDIEIKIGDKVIKGEIKAHKPLDH